MSKPILNVATIGDLAHGKTTLTAAITKVLAKSCGGIAIAYNQIDSSPEEESRGMSINASRVQYESSKRTYKHVDCPGNVSVVYTNNMKAGVAGADCAILVVSAIDGSTNRTREHVSLARQAGVPHIVVFLSKCDVVDDPEIRDLVEADIREMLSQANFDGDDVPVVTGSGLKALEGDSNDEKKILELVGHLDSVPQREYLLWLYIYFAWLILRARLCDRRV
ncbi:hypothetical protein BOTBODRAFT_156800 [Botryobasidium botryosum FD-172 SS1]|uniref:Tr-type G domain-containing protein n=1 Tax=Botryobasidium botryosum (strain FD-172 SS1) TaxID=930990 RepID=A0A067MMU0_BOTB1|nr:hypothetical protein BOTBODRAFT_156800 [Botryobasidium botryosum FD-172 SS1]